MKLTKSKSVVTAFLVSAVLSGGMSTSFAATQTQTLDMTSMTMPTFAAVRAGDVLTLKISGLSGSDGVYVSVCDKTVSSATKGTLCDTNQAHMAWITPDGGQGSSAGATGGAITIADTLDCKTTACVLYVRGDHNNSAAYQLIRKIDLVFASGGVAKLTDAVTGTASGVTMTPNVPHDLTYRVPVTFSLTTSSGLAVTLTSLTPDCSVAGNVVTALAGETVCAIQATTSGNDTYSALKVNFPFYTHSLVQQATIAWPTATSFQTSAVAMFRRVKTNAALYPRLTSTTPKICKASTVGPKWKLVAVKAGTCTVVVSSPADKTPAKRWTALNQPYTLVLTSVASRG